MEVGQLKMQFNSNISFDGNHQGLSLNIPRKETMSENIFWVYNGWAILITLLGPIYMVVDAELRVRKGILLLRSLSGPLYIASIILLFFVSGWIAAGLYIPFLIVGISIASIIKHRGLG